MEKEEEFWILRSAIASTSHLKMDFENQILWFLTHLIQVTAVIKKLFLAMHYFTYLDTSIILISRMMF